MLMRTLFYEHNEVVTYILVSETKFKGTFNLFQVDIKYAPVVIMLEIWYQKQIVM